MTLNLSEVSLIQTFWRIFKSIEQEKCPQAISLIWPSDLVFDPRWPKFELIPDFIKTNLLTNFQVEWAWNVASKAPTMYFFKVPIVAN